MTNLWRRLFRHGNRGCGVLDVYVKESSLPSSTTPSESGMLVLCAPPAQFDPSALPKRSWRKVGQVSSCGTGCADTSRQLNAPRWQNVADSTASTRWRLQQESMEAVASRLFPTTATSGADTTPPSRAKLFAGSSTTSLLGRHCRRRLRCATRWAAIRPLCGVSWKLSCKMARLISRGRAQPSKRTARQYDT